MTRYHEIDLLRGSAFCAMVIYHTAFDLVFFLGYAIPVTQGGWYVFARSIAITFLLLVGINAYLKVQQTKSTRLLLKQGLLVLGAGLLVTIVTWLVIPEQYVRFGILHLIGVSILLIFPFIKRPLIASITGIISIVGGFWLKTQTVTQSWTIPLGLLPRPFSSVDYFPLFPWFGVVLLGIGLGHLLYPYGKPRYPLTIKNKVFEWCGKHSLVLYLLHQPSLIGIILGARSIGLL